MHHLLNFARRVPGFGTRSLSLDDYYKESQQLGIRTLELPFCELYGATRTVRGKTYIGLRAGLSRSDKLLTAWHEYLHGALHHPTTCNTLRSVNRAEQEPKWEKQAEIFALAAYIPTCDIWRHDVADLCEIYEISPEIVERRIMAWGRYGI